MAVSIRQSSSYKIANHESQNVPVQFSRNGNEKNISQLKTQNRNTKSTGN
jgi:hypothetical protein